MSPAAALPIFPLNTVLFPGGVLPLRIFEARYMDMVRRAMRDRTEFGVVLIRKGREVGEPGVDTADVGCRARIDDWNMEQLGLLEIATTGTERFAIGARRVEPDGLMVADVAPLETEHVVALADESRPCRALLERIVQRLEDERAQQAADATDETKPPPSPIAKPYRFDDATWVGNRLAELLPIPLGAKQKLMALTDGPTRLSIIQQYLKQHGVV